MNNIINKFDKGLTTLPCGRPQFVNCVSDKILTLTLKLLLERKALIQLKALVNIVVDRFKKIRTVLVYLYNYVQIGE